MVEELQAAEDAGERAWIIGHIPLGKVKCHLTFKPYLDDRTFLQEDALQDQSNYYDQVVQRYKNTIAAQFFGHSHKVCLRMGFQPVLTTVPGPIRDRILRLHQSDRGYGHQYCIDWTCAYANKLAIFPCSAHHYADIVYFRWQPCLQNL